MKSVCNFYLVLKTAFFYPSDLVNTKTTIPLRVGEEHWIYTSPLGDSCIKLVRFAYGVRHELLLFDSHSVIPGILD